MALHKAVYVFAFRCIYGGYFYSGFQVFKSLGMFDHRFFPGLVAIKKQDYFFQLRQLFYRLLYFRCKTVGAK